MPGRGHDQRLCPGGRLMVFITPDGYAVADAFGRVRIESTDAYGQSPRHAVASRP